MQYLLYLTTFLLPFYFIRFSVLGKIPTNIFEVAVLVVFLATVATKRKKFISGGYLPYLLMVVVSASVLLSSDLISALGILKGWFVIPLFYYLAIINTFDRHNLPKLSIPIFLSVISVSLWAVLQKLGVITTLFYQTNDPSFNQYLSLHFRVFGPFESPNYLAMFLVPMIFLSIPIFSLIKNRIAKILLALIYLIPLFALFLSGSRGGVAGFVLAILIYVFISKKEKFGNSAILSTCLATTVFLALSLVAYKFGFDPKSDSIRIEIYKYALQLLRENYFFGIGLGDFARDIASINPLSESFRTFALPYALHPHNIFFAFWLNLGLIGFLVFVATVVSFFWQMLKNSINNIIWAGALMAMISILAHGLFDTTYFKNDLSAIFWLIVAIGYIINRPQISKYKS